jgi:hypothetical protein
MNVAIWNHSARAATRANQLLLNLPICTDDYGTAIYVCQFTGNVTDERAILLGALTPSVAGSYVCASNAREAYRLNRAAFDEMEANCNTCKHFKRIAQPKRKDGMFEGSCLTKNLVRMTIHPEDPMHMECWQGRTA